jgi:hypothetical protein
MRTTLRIEDDLLRELKRQAEAERTSVTKLVNHVIRRGLMASTKSRVSNRRFRQKTFSMGPPLVDLTKALALAAALEDEETLNKLARGK